MQFGRVRLLLLQDLCREVEERKRGGRERERKVEKEVEEWERGGRGRRGEEKESVKKN